MQSRRDDIGRMIDAGDATPRQVDDWHRVQMETKEEMHDLFVKPFYFGCEADDPMNSWAFNSKVNPMGAKLKAVFSSDIGHWDVPDMREVVEEAYEMVEHELMTDSDFEDFVFTNACAPVRRHEPELLQGHGGGVGCSESIEWWVRWNTLTLALSHQGRGYKTPLHPSPGFLPPQE